APAVFCASSFHTSDPSAIHRDGETVRVRGTLLHCRISARPTSAMGQKRPKSSRGNDKSCLEWPRSGHGLKTPVRSRAAIAPRISGAPTNRLENKYVKNCFGTYRGPQADINLGRRSSGLSTAVV